MTSQNSATIVAQQMNDEESSLWSELAACDSLEECAPIWLELQSGLLEVACNGLVVASAAQGGFAPVGIWPRQGGDPERLADAVERVIEQQCGLVAELDSPGHYVLAFPVDNDDKLQGVSAFEVVVSAEEQLPGLMEQLQWGTSWLELALLRDQSQTDRTDLKRLRSAVDLLAVVLGQSGFEAAAIALATELAKSLDCERTSLGVLNGQHVRLQAVSHSAAVDKKMNLTRSIERVMEEALQQRREILFPLIEDEGQIYREHEALSRQQAMVSLMSCPLYSGAECYAVVTCERAADHPFTISDLIFVRSVVALCGPALEAKYLNDRSLAAKTADSVKTQVGRFFGPNFLGRKLIVFCLLLLAAFCYRAEGDYRLLADVTLEGAVQQAIVAPYDGYIVDAQVRAGDRVAAGDLLCALDDRDLRLEKLAKQSEMRQLDSKYQAAEAQHERAEAAIIKAQQQQLQAQLNLLDSQLERIRMTAPFAGLVVSGDLSQRLGSAVGKGELLFELTPLDRYRVILEVDERRITDVALGQQGTLVLSGLPQQRFPFSVEKITPLTVAEDGRSYFRVEAALGEIAESLRPGMEGVGKIQVDKRRLISIWSRDLRDWLSLRLWKWLP